MKTNLKLNSSISLQALEAKARKAAAIAAATAIVQQHDNAKKPHKKPIPAIERDIRSIYQALKSNANETEVVTFERPDKGVSYLAIINIFRQADLHRQKEEESAYRERLAQGADRKTLAKPFKAVPIVRYTFYPSTINHNRLGSIAIYGENASSTRALILKSGHLFGHSIISATLEMGRRPFVDVTLAA